MFNDGNLKISLGTTKDLIKFLLLGILVKQAPLLVYLLLVRTGHGHILTGL